MSRQRELSTRAVYLYCLVEADGGGPVAAASAPQGLPGATPPRAVALPGGLALVASDVPLPEYSAAAIEERLSDLAWVSARALAHERVVEHFAGLGTVLPMKLFTLFTSEERARADVAARRPAIAGTLARLHGAREWGVRISFDPAAARLGSASPQKGATADAADAVAPVSGRDFLQRKKQRQEAGRELARSAERTVEEVYQTLTLRARAARRREPIPEAGARLLLDAAFLVPKAAAAAFEAALAEGAGDLAACGCEATLTGPWPPYNFVEELE
jgi:hypothetical protein